MDARERNYVESVRKAYSPEGKEDDRYVELRKLEKKIKRPIEILGFFLGIVGVLLFGFGLCICLGAVEIDIAIGIVLGLVGLAVVIVNYPLGRHLLERRKKRYAKEVLDLTDSLLNIKE